METSRIGVASEQVPKRRKENKLEPLEKWGPSLRNQTQWSHHLKTFDKSDGIKKSDFLKNTRLIEIRD